MNLPLSPARVIMATVLADWDAFGILETSKAAINQGNVAHKCGLCNLN